MKTPFRPDAKPVKQQPYRLNPRYKEKVKFEVDQILEARLIEAVKESKWIILVVVQEKETSREVRIYVDLRKLNDSCLHDPFQTRFTNEVLENVGGQEMYSFADGFSVYH